jgi:hypothetical protein
LEYNLENLHWREFERLIAFYLKEKIGEGLWVFDGSQDKGRDAEFRGEANDFPSKSSPFRGDWIFQLNHYALKVHRLRRGLKSRLFLIINLLKCHVVKWISAECFATESLAPKVHSFGLTLWDSKTQNN